MSEYIVYFGNDGKSDVRMAMAKQHGAVVHGEIVRCCDCKHFTYANKKHSGHDWCDFHYQIGWSVNGFCAWGKRKEGE